MNAVINLMQDFAIICLSIANIISVQRMNRAGI